MNKLVKAVLFSISTAIISTPAMAATQHKEPVNHTVKHDVAPTKHDQHKHPAKPVAKKDVKKNHAPAKKPPVHHDAKHDVKHG